MKGVVEQLQKIEHLNVCSGAVDGVSDCTVSQELLWLSRWDSSGTQKGVRPPLEASTRGLVKRQQPYMQRLIIKDCE